MFFFLGDWNVLDCYRTPDSGLQLPLLLIPQSLSHLPGFGALTSERLLFFLKFSRRSAGWISAFCHSASASSAEDDQTGGLLSDPAPTLHLTLVATATEAFSSLPRPWRRRLIPTRRGNRWMGRQTRRDETVGQNVHGTSSDFICIFCREICRFSFVR